VPVSVAPEEFRLNRLGELVPEIVSAFCNTIFELYPFTTDTLSMVTALSTMQL